MSNSDYVTHLPFYKKSIDLLIIGRWSFNVHIPKLMPISQPFTNTFMPNYAHSSNYNYDRRDQYYGYQ